MCLGLYSNTFEYNPGGYLETYFVCLLLVGIVNYSY